MKILFILASDLIYKYREGLFKINNNGFTPLSLITLAACVPDKYKAEMEVIDEGVQRADYDKKQFDVVVISCCASSSNRAYELSKYWQKRGAYTAIGGVHATLCPDEVAPHCNSVMAGYGEAFFARFIEDYANGNPKPKYEAEHCDGFLSAPFARRDLVKHVHYHFKNTIIANRGCSNKCRFCTISQFTKHKGHLKRPVGEVIDEIKQNRFKKVCFLDPSPTSDMEYAKELFTALIPLKLKYFTDITITAAKDDALMDLLEKSGCYEILTGFESFNPQNLLQENKEFNQVEKYREYVRKFHDKKISVLGSFVLGMEHDTVDSLKQLPDFIEYIQVDWPRLTIFTPFPGTAPYADYNDNNRLITKNLDYYDLMHVVHQPRRMSPLELQRTFRDVWRKTYSWPYMYRRMKNFRAHKTDLFFQNLYFKHLGKYIPETLDYV